jgi:hypothetical protein
MFFRHVIKIALNTAFVIATVPLFVTGLHAQSKPYEGPTDEAGDPSASRLGLMNGNRVSLQISNKVSFGGWPSPLVSLWPNDATGLNTFDSFNLIVGNMVFIKKCATCSVDSVPVTDEGEIQSLAIQGQLDTLWYAQSSSIQPNFMDVDPTGRVEWGFYPVFGYFNRTSEYPAMSNHSESWPPEGWPSRGLETKWPGEWNGRFGRGVKYADIEAYWACNDAQDQENLQSISRIRFYPRPGVKIGDLHPDDITVQRGLPWGGLGMRAEVRAYQWNNQQSRDASFFEYNVSNISDYDLARAVFGFYLDAANGNKSPTSALEDQIGFYDVLEDFTYTWSRSGTGFGGGTPPVSGWAFLESPGVATDGIDNDDDGMADERRDNPAEGAWGGYAGATRGRDAVVAAFTASHDLSKFLKFWGYKSIDEVPAVQQGLWWPGDEDGDWTDGNDKNGNGVYDSGEDPGDDVGLDGVGPGELNYAGPDADGTECNHKPDYTEGKGCEPNFAATDISESDMLGLTSFVMFPHPQTGSPQLRFDKAVYDTLAAHRLVEFFGVPSNLYCAFGSGTFRFSKGRTERLSMANVNSYEDLSGLNDASRKHTAPSLYVKKRVVDGIYASDYRFVQPPLFPTLTAKAGDGKVYLSWDDRADKLTREPFLRGVNDFEGYKLYKATDKHFQDAEVLRDAYGNAAGKKPIFQCDLRDSIKGIPDYSYYNGLGYYLGDDAGIQHYFVDENVQNGRTYYYALVAYDYGLKETTRLGVSIPPTENNAVIDLDENEDIRFVGLNVQVVTPHQQAAGYVPPNVTMIDPANVQANGTIQPLVFNADLVNPNHVYKIKFDTTTVGYSRTAAYRHKRDAFVSTVGYSVYDVTSNNKLVYKESPTSHVQRNWETVTLSTSATPTTQYLRPSSNGMTSEVIDGMQLFIKPNTVAPMIDTTLTGWQTGSTPIDVRPNVPRSQYFAYDYNIVFIDTTRDSSYKTKITRVTGGTPVWDVGNNQLRTSRVLLRQSFPFHVINKLFSDSSGYKDYEELDVVVDDADSNGVYDPAIDFALVGYPVQSGAQRVWGGTVFGIRFPAGTPKPGDVYRVKFTSPLKDSIMFTVNVESTVSESMLKEDMRRIKVVPNPYVVTNTMEPYISNRGYNQRRQLLFTHIPARSTIKIFTSSGVFIQQLDVENSSDDGTVHWDMLTKEGLEIAAGIYVYQVKSKVTGDEKLGKFAVIK